jgi:hypothetical protein
MNDVSQILPLLSCSINAVVGGLIQRSGSTKSQLIAIDIPMPIRSRRPKRFILLPGFFPESANSI